MYELVKNYIFQQNNLGNKEEMKQKLIRFIAMLIAIFLPHIFITALGNKDWMPECEKALQAHPEVISYEVRGQKHGGYYEVILTDERIIEFDTILADSGGGFYASVSKIGEFWLMDSCDYRKKENQPWEHCSVYGIYFIDLSRMLGIKIETMVDCRNNYDKILELIRFLAQEQYKTGYQESVKLQHGRGLHDSKTRNLFPFHFVFSENRKAVVNVLAIHEYPQWVWDGIQDDEIQWCVNRYGENWREKLNNDLPKIRKSLGLE